MIVRLAAFGAVAVIAEFDLGEMTWPVAVSICTVCQHAYGLIADGSRMDPANFTILKAKEGTNFLNS